MGYLGYLVRYCFYGNTLFATGAVGHVEDVGHVDDVVVVVGRNQVGAFVGVEVVDVVVVNVVGVNDGVVVDVVIVFDVVA